MSARTVTMRTPRGEATEVKIEDVAAAEAAGYTPEVASARVERLGEEAKAERYDTLGSQILAGTAGTLRGATLGGSDVVASLFGSEGDVEALREVRKYNPGISLGTEILGGVAPALLSGGTGTIGQIARATPSGGLSAGATALGETIGAGGGAARQIAGTALGAGAEGAVQNVGAYVSDVALENKQLSAEGFLASAGQGALWGGAAGGAMGGIERGTIAARRLFPRSVAKDREAVQVIEERFLAGATDQIKAGDDLEKAARSAVDDLKLRSAELNLEREKLRGASDAASRVRVKEIAVEKAQISAARKALRDQKNAERAAEGLPDIPPEVAAPSPPPLDEASVVPTGPPSLSPDIAPALAGVDGLEARLAATQGLLDQGVQFADIGAAAQGRIDDLSIASQNTAHEAGMLADDAAQGGDDAAERLAQKTEDYAARKQAVKDWITKYQPGAKNRFSSSLTGDDLAGGAPRRTDRTRVLPEGGVDFEAQAGDRVWAGMGSERDVVLSPVVNAPAIGAVADVQLPLPELTGRLSTPKGRDMHARQTLARSESARDEWAKYTKSRTRDLNEVDEVSEGLSISPQRLAEMRHEFATKLSPDELDASLYYSEAGFSVMNTALRYGHVAEDPRVSKKIADLASAIRKHPLAEDTYVVRGMRGEGGDFFANAVNAGDTFVDPAFTSVSAADKPNAYTTKIRIRLPKGTEAAPIPALGNENELLIQAGARFRVLTKRVEGGKTLIEMEVIGGAPGTGSAGAPPHAVPAGFDTSMPSDGMKLFETDTPAVRLGVPRWGESSEYANTVHVLTPSELAGVPLFGTTVHPDRIASVKSAWAEGKSLPAVEIDVTPSGRYSVQDGNHRLMAAASDNRPIAVRFKQAKTEFAADYGDDIAKRVREALPPGTAIRRSGADLDSAYDDLIEQASNAANRDELAAIAKQAAALEEEILERVAFRGGADAEQVAKIRAKRAEYGWTAEDVAARRAEKLAIAKTNDPITPSAKMRAEQADLDAYERVVRSNQGRADMAHTYPKTLGEEILAKGGEATAAQPAAAGHPRDAGRFIADADEAIRVVGEFERAQYELTQELGAAAPPAAVAHAQQYAAALDDQARKTTEAIAGKADDAVKNGNMPSPAALVSLPKAPLVAGQAKKEAGRLADVAGMLELLSSAGDIPLLPDWLKPSNLPVIGPMLSMYLKYRGMKAVYHRLGGRVAATAEAKVAARSAEIRDRAADIADVLLEGASKAAKRARPAVVVGGAKLTDALKNELYPGAERKDEKTAQDAAKARIEELSRAVADPDGVRAAVREKVGTVDPDLANAIADATLVKLQYLQRHAPKAPPPSMFGPRPWKLSTGEIERFARRVRAAEDPLTVLQDVERGTVTAEAAEAMREVYPSLFSEVQTRLLSRAAELEAKLPYQRVLHLSLLFDAPLDDSLRPQNLSVLQSAHSTSPAQQGGQNAGQPPAPSVAGPVNVARLYETPEMRRASRR